MGGGGAAGSGTLHGGVPMAGGVVACQTRPCRASGWATDACAPAAPGRRPAQPWAPCPLPGLPGLQPLPRGILGAAGGAREWEGQPGCPFKSPGFEVQCYLAGQLIRSPTGTLSESSCGLKIENFGWAGSAAAAWFPGQRWALAHVHLCCSWAGRQHPAPGSCPTHPGLGPRHHPLPTHSLPWPGQATVLAEKEGHCPAPPPGGGPHWGPRALGLGDANSLTLPRAGRLGQHRPEQGRWLTFAQADGPAADALPGRMGTEMGSVSSQAGQHQSSAALGSASLLKGTFPGLWFFFMCGTGDSGLAPTREAAGGHAQYSSLGALCGGLPDIKGGRAG